MADVGEIVEVVLTGMSGEQLTTLRVKPETTVSMVKEMVQNDFGYPPSSQQLLLQGQIVEENDSLETLPHPILFSLVLLPFDKRWALDNAVDYGREAAVRNLLSVARDSDETRALLLTHPETPLFNAVRQGHAAVFQALLAAAPDQLVKREMVLAKSSYGLDYPATDTALHFAAGKGNVKQCRALFQCGLNEETQRAMLLEKGSSGKTALHRAIEGNRALIAQTLLEFAPSVEVQVAMLEAKDDNGQTAMEAFPSSLALPALKELVTSLGL